MTSVEGMVGVPTIRDLLNRSRRPMADERSLVFCNLPSRKSVSEWEPSRMSYYNPSQPLSVPFKWEVAPGTPIVDELSQRESPESPLQLRPPPSALNSPLQPHVSPSYKDLQKPRLLPKFRSYSRPEATFSMSHRSNGSATTAERSAAHHRVRSKGSMSRRSEFDWPEVSDDDECSTSRTTDDQEPPSSTATTASAKNWSFSSSSFSSTSTQSHSPSPSPVNAGGGARGGGSTRDLFLLRNLVNFAAASAAAPANRYVIDAGRSSTAGSEEGEEGEESNDHFCSHPRFLSCIPSFSKVRKIQSLLSNNHRPAVFNFSTRLTPGSKNKGSRDSL